MDYNDTEVYFLIYYLISIFIHNEKNKKDNLYKCSTFGSYHFLSNYRYPIFISNKLIGNEE
jgi:hypothetical protein